MTWKDDNIERAIDDKQDGLLGNRLRLFVSSGELAIRRRWLKGTMLPLATGKGAKLVGFRAGVELVRGGGFVTPGNGLLAGQSCLAWLECRTWAVFGHATLAVDPDFTLGLMVNVRPVYQTPPDVDPVGVLGFERALVGQEAPDARILAQYDAWLTGRAGAWSRAAWVRDRLGKVLATSMG